ncbi:MAG TPA: L,D-transpeptidase family protein [Sphingomicrobium sp.]|nr:L,D-transpeptidase family protein [Sphingomicrobium sp.]
MQAPASAGSLPAASAVAAFYDTWRTQPIWFRGGAVSPAANQLVQILRRAPFDGFALGPQLAAQAEAAILQARSGNPQAIAAAERTLSTAWVAYVQALKKPTDGMIYAYPVLQPQGVRADQILLTAAAAPSLEQHLSSVSNVNPVYAQLRAAAIAEAQATGSMVPDPRLIANLDRARSIPASGRYVLVDAATQRLWMYENGVPVDSMKVIVGTSETPTPMIASIIHYATFNPYWNVPDNLIRKTVAPSAVREGAAYLRPRGYEVMADWTENSAVIPSNQIDWKAVAAGQKKIRVRQQPGPGNSMGKFKFSFPNGEDIFLHDTPSKDLFAKSNRALSNGCVRLEDARRFARWLMGREPVAPGADPEIHVQLPQGVPIFLTYLTAHPDGGRVAYTADVYGWDRQAQVAGR